MRQTLRRHVRDVLAIALMAALALVAVTYILAHQVAFQAPSWLPGGEPDRYEVTAEFTSAAAVVPGQGQPVTVAGVQVGDVKAVRVEGGRALVTLSIERRRAPIYHDATVLLRPRTPLQDMFLALDPGTPAAGAIGDRGRLPVSQTLPDVKFDEILANLDSDARTYLRVLISVAGGALADGAQTETGAPSAKAVGDLRAALKQFEPIARDTRAVAAALAKRRRNVAGVVHRFRQIAVRLAHVDADVAGLVSAANRTFAATASQDRRLAAALRELPGTLSETTRALGSVDRLGGRLGPTLQQLRPFARSLGPALRATQPFFTATAPVLRSQLRPFTRDVRPLAAELRPAARDLRANVAPLTRTLRVVNTFFDALAYNPRGAEEGYLFWGSWLSHIGTSLSGLQDAHGAVLRSVVLATCSQLDALHQVEIGNPSLGPILNLLNPADRLKVCPGAIP